MADDPKAIDEALAVVSRTLDRLTARGQTDAAFDIARAHFSASVRASWPASLVGIAVAIDHALENTALALTETEADDLRGAAGVLRSVIHR